MIKQTVKNLPTNWPATMFDIYSKGDGGNSELILWAKWEEIDLSDATKKIETK